MKTQPVIFLLLLLLVFSCKKEEPDPDDNNAAGEVVITEKTKVLDSGSRAAINSLDTISYTFQFEAGSSFAGELQTNDILVDDVSSLAPYGFLRKVSSVENKDGSIVVKTSQASLEEVIEQGSVALHSGSLKNAEIAEIQLAEGVALASDLKSTNLLGFDMNFEHNIGGSQTALITGSIYFDLDFNFELDISLDGVDYFKSSVVVEEIASLGLEVSSDIDLDEEISFAQITFTPWTIMIGPVPLVFVPKVELIMNSDLTISGTVQTYASQNYNREIGLEYESGGDGDGWSKINSTDPAPGYEIQPAALTDNAEYIVKVGPKASLKLYGIAGPYVDLLLVSDLAAEKSSNGFNMDYYLNLESNAGVEIDLLFYELEKNYQLFDVNLVHLELNDEPLHQSFSIKHPADGARVNISEVLNIQTYITGLPPSEVRFYVDDGLINTDTEEPFEYAWTVEGSQGLHSIKAIADYGSTTIESEVEVSFQSGGWQQIDVSELFTDDYNLEVVRFSDTQNGWILGKAIQNIWSEPVCLRTTDGGKTWYKVYSGDAGHGYGVTDFEVLGENTAYFTAGSWLYGTTDGGVSWTRPFSSSEFHEYVDADQVEVNENGDVFALDQSAMHILESGGSGEWQLVTEYGYQDELEISSVRWMSFPVDNTGYFFGSSFDEATEISTSGLYMTTDKGAHWTHLDLVFDVSQMYSWNFKGMLFIDNSTGWITGFAETVENDGFVLKTTDGGATWSTLLTEYSPSDFHFIDKSNGYISFLHYPDVNLGYTDDGGDNWYAFDTPFEDNTFTSGCVYFVDQDHGWYVNKDVLLRYALQGE